MIKSETYNMEISRLCDLVFTMPHMRKAKQDCFDAIEDHVWLNDTQGHAFILANCSNPNAYFEHRYHVQASNVTKVLSELALWALWSDLYLEHTKRWQAGMRRSVK